MLRSSAFRLTLRVRNIRYKSEIMASKIVVSIQIQATPDKVFDYTQDYGNRLTWDTFLRVARLESADRAGQGVKAWCVSKHGLGMETQYVSYNRQT